jgi:hypothetical protein
MTAPIVGDHHTSTRLAQAATDFHKMNTDQPSDSCSFVKIRGLFDLTKSDHAPILRFWVVA